MTLFVDKNTYSDLLSSTKESKENEVSGRDGAFPDFILW